VFAHKSARFFLVEYQHPSATIFACPLIFLFAGFGPCGSFAASIDFDDTHPGLASKVVSFTPGFSPVEKTFVLLRNHFNGFFSEPRENR
jgi:hypothetical protein